MKIIHINAVNTIASTGRIAYEMDAFFHERGAAHVVAYAQGESANPDREFVIGSPIDRKLHGLLSRISGKQGYFSHAATRRLLKFMDKYRPDVAVLGNLHGNYIHLPMLLRYLAKKDIATVVILHDCWFYTGKCCHYTVEGCYRWQDACGHCPQLKKYNKSWFFDRTSAMLRDKRALFQSIPRLAVVGVSDWLVGEAKRAPVFQNAKIFKRIYNWVDTAVFSPRDTAALREELGLSGKKIILAVASSWGREKGIDTVLEIARRLGEDERLVLVGDSGHIEPCEQILRLPATHSVDRLAEYYSAADVFLQPSLEETFGKVTAEALACGTPAVCFASTANPELVGDGCGAAVPPGDIAGMLSEIRKILAAGKEPYRESCRNFAQSNFEKEHNLEAYAELFKTIAGDSV